MTCAKVTSSTIITSHLSEASKNIANHINYHFPQPLTNYCPNFTLHHFNFKSFHLSSTLNCKSETHDFDNDFVSSSAAAAFAVLGVDPSCSAAQLKSAFRAKVKEFHPDVKKNRHESDMMIRCVIQAYEMLSNYSRSEIIEREFSDPFDDPDSEALDIFVNEIYCIGKGHGVDYQVQLAVGQCPRSCIHYVTPSQRIILEELLNSILDTPYETSAEEELLYGLIVKAKYENNRYQKPKKQPKASTENVDWF